MKFFVLSSILVLLFLLIKTKIRPSILFFSLLCIFSFVGLIETKKMLINFTNQAIMTLILLVIVASVLEKTQIINLLSRIFFVKHSYQQSIFRISFLSALLSAFMNNTAVVASFMAPITNNKHFPPSKLLIPLSYAAILGGSTTLIGTATNLIVNGFAIDSGLKPFKIYDFIYVGIPVTILGIVYLTFFSHKTLPGHKTHQEKKAWDYFLEAQVLEGSSLINKSIKENNLRNLESIYLAEIIRKDQLISSVSPHEVIKKDDILVFAGEINNIKDLKQFKNLKIFGQISDILKLKKNLIEVVVSHRSDMVGKKIKDVNFRGTFDAAVVAVRRGNKKLSGKIGLIELEPGDDLILAVGDDFSKRDARTSHFYFVNELNVNSKLSNKKSLLAISLFVIGIITGMTGFLSLFQTMLCVLLLYVMLKFINFQEIKKNVNMELIVLIGSAIGISQVLISTGASKWIADFIISLGSGFGALGCFISIYMLTRILSEVITNAAAASIVFPLAFSVAGSLGVSSLPFVMAVAYGASGCFLTPYGYQTNILVYSAGRYTFSDYFKIGFPLFIIYSIIVIILIPVFFPF